MRARPSREPDQAAHKAQLASDRTSCHSATANEVRLVLHTAAYWLMHTLRSRLPRTSPLARCEFTTLRQRLIKIGARIVERAARIRIHLPTRCPQRNLFAQMAARAVRYDPTQPGTCTLTLCRPAVTMASMN